MAALVKFHCCVRTTLLVVFFLHASNFVKGYPRIYGDLNFPSGGRLYPLPFGGRGGILESRAVPRYSNYNYNSYGSYQQQNRNNGMNPLLAMWAFDMW
ncbi:hypothetical protein BaRGS_00012477 [Batillaria attramentaria]|uniref:Secreted protein n=1 Tax=Batillaria attramentaria TaxID=370345 RepID=A0ABD0LA90_9CAEN